MKVTPLRMDIVSRTSYPKESLLRFVLANGDLVVDKNHSKPGRGIYLLPANLEDPRLERCFSKAFKKQITKAMIQEAIHG